jgi:hypothetical protein
MEFRYQLFGYRRPDVDRFVSEQEAAVRSLKAEIDKLRAAEPLLGAADEISGLLTSFAVAVSTTREQAERDAMITRRTAEEYADGLKQEAVRLFEEERATATSVAEDIIRNAREEAAIVARAQDRVENALDEAAKGIFSLIHLFDRMRPDDSAGAPAPDGAEVEPDADRGAGEPEPAPEPAPEPVMQPDAKAPRPPAEPPFDAVPVDPDKGMIVSFSPPPDLPETSD